MSVTSKEAQDLRREIENLEYKVRGLRRELEAAVARVERAVRRVGQDLLAHEHSVREVAT